MEQIRKRARQRQCGPAFTDALQRHTRLRSFSRSFPRPALAGLPAPTRNPPRYAGMASVKYIARMPEERRLAILTAFVKAQKFWHLDEAVDVLIC